MRRYLFLVFFSLIQCSCWAGVRLDVVKVGPANCTVFKVDNRALVYDCGYSTGSWITGGHFVPDKKVLFSNLMKGVEKVGIVISHDDADHKNLLPALRFLLGNKIQFEINVTNQNELPINELSDLQMFFGSDFQVYPIIPSFCGDNRNITTNDRTLILKVVRTIRGRECAFLMTGDATGKTFDKVSKKQIIRWNNPNIRDNNLYWKTVIDDLFSDIVCFMPSHHGTDTDGSLMWSHHVLEQSSFPVLTVISSDPSVRNHSPTVESVDSLNDMIVLNLKRTAKSKNYFCVPHDMDCYYEAFSITDTSLSFAEDSSIRVIKYPSFHKGFVIPMFVTSNSRSGIYTISLEDDLSVTLFDNTVQLYGMKDDCVEPLYDVCKAYMHYYAQKKRQEVKRLFDLLQIGVFFGAEDNFDSFFHSFVLNQNAVIKNTKILSYLARVVPLLDVVIEQTASAFTEMQDKIELLKIIDSRACP